MDGSWTYAGDLVRIGGIGSIVSNIEISNGSVKPTDEVISTVLPDPNHQLFNRSIKDCLQGNLSYA